MASRITPDELRKIAPEVYEREFGAESREKPAPDRKPDQTPKTPQKPRGSRENAYTRPTIGEVFAFLALLVQAIVAAIVFTRW